MKNYIKNPYSIIKEYTPRLIMGLLLCACNLQGDESKLDSDFRPGLEEPDPIVKVTPTSLSYSSPVAIYTYNNVSDLLTNNITDNIPTANTVIDTYSISPNLTTNTGLDFNTSTGVISGKPTIDSAATTYTITASNNLGSTTATVNIRTGMGFTVNSFSDALNDASTVDDCDTDPGAAKVCTLRAAVQQLNSWDSGTRGLIVLPSGTITIGSTITIFARMEIVGVSKTTTILTGANQPLNLFDIFSNNILISDLTMTSAQGSAILFDSAANTLEINRVLFSQFSSGTTGGAIKVIDGILYISESKFENNTATQGGAIYLTSGAHYIDTTHFLSNNSTNGATCSTVTHTRGGGAIAAFSELTITNSLFELNSASSCGGALFSNSFSSKTIENTTFANNSAHGGSAIYSRNGTEEITNCTIIGNINSAATTGTAPVFKSGVGWNLSLKNSIIAGNSIGGGATPNNCKGTIVDLGNNISDLNDCLLSTGFNTDPQVNALADNGGYTKTFSLQATSPAINAGDNNYCISTYDQRGLGFDRIVDSVCDIGALEKQ